jgi:hypothetical protein
MIWSSRMFFCTKRKLVAGTAPVQSNPDNQSSVFDELGFGLAPVLAIKPLDAARGVDQLLLAREERVAVRTDLEPDLGLRRPGFPRMTTGAMHVSVLVFRMDIGLHDVTYS